MNIRQINKKNWELAATLYDLLKHLGYDFAYEYRRINGNTESVIMVYVDSKSLVDESIKCVEVFTVFSFVNKAEPITINDIMDYMNEKEIVDHDILIQYKGRIVGSSISAVNEFIDDMNIILDNKHLDIIIKEVEHNDKRLKI